MSSAPFFTIAIPTFNRAEMLRPCLESLVRQSFKDFEIIVADNASTDETPAVVKAIGDPRIQYLRHERNIGAYENFIHCSTLGRGEFLVLHQDDDLLHEDFLNRCHQVAATRPEVTVYGCVALAGSAAGGYTASVLPDLLHGRFDWPLRDEPMVVDGRRMAVRFLFSHCMNHPAIALRRSALVRAGGYGPAPDCYCDLVTIPRVMAQGMVAYDPRVGGLGRLHVAQYSSQTTKAKRELLTHHTFRYQIDSLRELVPDWPHILRRELASHSAKNLMPMLKDLVGFRAPAEWTSIVWERCQQAEPRRTRLTKILVSRIGAKNTLRLMAGG